MNEENSKIRLATIYDINKLTDLHCNSFKPEEHVPMMLGRNYVKATYKWQVLSKDAYVLVSEKENNIIGLVAVCDGSFTKAMFVACLPEFIQGLLLKPKLIFKKMLWKRLFRRPELTRDFDLKDDLIDFAQMTIGAIDKNYRGTGMFCDLIQATKIFSKNRGSKAIRAGVYKKNLSSRRVFIKSGWVEVPEFETEDTIFYVSFFDKSLAIRFGINL